MHVPSRPTTRALLAHMLAWAAVGARHAAAHTASVRLPFSTPTKLAAPAAVVRASTQTGGRAAPRSCAVTDRRENVGQPKAVGPSSELAELLSAAQPRARSGLPDLTRPFTVLGIETSCDDTAAAVVRSDGTVLGEAIAKQDAIHAEWGGVVPGLARDAHAAALSDVVGRALSAAGLSSVSEVDGIGVTVGPGLEICLRVGCRHAQELSAEFNKPFVAVHHLEAHCLMTRLAARMEDAAAAAAAAASGGAPGAERASDVAFPFLCLLLSGGHCQLLLCRGVGDYAILGSTLDDALGEAYDKVARLLGLDVGAGGGAALERLAIGGSAGGFALPVPMSKRKDTSFSFAGLKTAVRTRLAALGREPTDAERADMAASFQEVSIRHVEQRLRYALRWCAQQRQPSPPEGAGAAEGGGEPGGALEPGESAPAADEPAGLAPPVDVPELKTLVVSGGVAANQALRARLRAVCDAEGLELVVPPPRLCTDNGVMVAWAAIERLQLGVSDEPLGLDVRARWPLGPAMHVTL